MEWSGAWEAQISLDTEDRDWMVEQELTVGLAGTVWEVEGALEIDSEGWDKLEIEASWKIGGVEVESKITFDASRVRFKKLTTDISLALGGLDLDVGLDLYSNHCWMDVRAQYERDGFEVDLKTRLGASKAFCLDFYRSDIELSFTTFGVPVDVESRISAKKGFERVDVETVFPLSPILTWLTIEADIRWTMDGRTMSLEPELEAMMAWEGLLASITLYAEARTGGVLCIDTLAVVGAALNASWDEVWIESCVSFDPAWNKKITGEKTYGWAAGVGAEVDGEGDWDVSIQAWSYAVDPSCSLDPDRSLAVAAQLSEAWELVCEVFIEAKRLSGVSLGLDIGW